MMADAQSGRPISPPSIAARAVCVPVPRTVSGAQPTRTPADAARSMIDRPCGNVTVSGFSTYVPAGVDRRAGDLGVRRRDREVEYRRHVGVME